MKSLKIGVGVTLLVVGFVGGLAIGFYFFTLGIKAIQANDVIRGLLHILIWAELAGGSFGLAFVVPGILILRTLDEEKAVEYSKGAELEPQPSVEKG